MAVLLGKRKRRTQEQSHESDTMQEVEQEATLATDEDVQAAFQRAFEAKFKPLEARLIVERNHEHMSEDEQQEIESDWEGIISEEDDKAIQVVEYSEFSGKTDADDVLRREMRAFMSSKPPSGAKKNLVSAKADPDSDEEAEAANLQNDFALQRLLKESHLLDPSSNSSSVSGSNRHKATDLRLASLGANKSALQQEKMPMAHRKGIIAKAQQREGKRRKEAQESGVILEKAVKAKKGNGEKRERGIGAPGVGSFRGGTLRLSKRDVASIQGPQRKANGKLRRKIQK